MKPLVLSLLLCSLALQGRAEDTPADQREWEAIQNSKEVTSYQAFIAKYPTSKLADKASRRIDELDWDKVDKKDLDAVRDFIKQHPDMGIDINSLTPEGDRHRSPGAAVSEPNPRVQIFAALEKLAKGTNENNIADIRSVWPSMPRDFVKRMQKEAKNGRIQFRPIGDPYVENESASISCWQVALTGSGDNETSTEKKVIIKFHHQNSEWIIDEIL